MPNVHHRLALAKSGVELSARNGCLLTGTFSLAIVLKYNNNVRHEALWSTLLNNANSSWCSNPIKEDSNHRNKTGLEQTTYMPCQQYILLSEKRFSVNTHSVIS